MALKSGTLPRARRTLSKQWPHLFKLRLNSRFLPALVLHGCRRARPLTFSQTQTLPQVGGFLAVHTAGLVRRLRDSPHPISSCHPQKKRSFVILSQQKLSSHVADCQHSAYWHSSQVFAKEGDGQKWKQKQDVMNTDTLTHTH